jgi:hypothetical protein
MEHIIKLHKYCNNTFYAIVYSCTPTELAILGLKYFFKKLSELIEKEHPLVKIEGLGIFEKFTDDFCNGKVDETYEHPLLGEYDEEIRPWQKYDYVNKKYVDWYDPLITKGEDDEGFKKAYAFSHRASFESSLLNAGIKKEDINNTYIFERSADRTKWFIALQGWFSLF